MSSGPKLAISGIINMLKTGIFASSAEPNQVPVITPHTTVAKLKTKKKPHISVTVVRSGPETRAGSRLNLFNRRGNIPPRLTDPKVFAAIAPICGGGDPEKAEAYVGIPTWVFHGAKDETVKLEKSEEMVDAVKAAGGEPKFTVYPEAEHDSWTATYDNPEFFEWIFGQKKGG